MALYNTLFGKNPFLPMLLMALDIDQENGNYESGRLRDAYIKQGKIVLYTRNGGGNREEYQGIIDKLSTHPLYVEDFDDEYDSTYAYIVFNTPKEMTEVMIEEIKLNQGDSSFIGDKFRVEMQEMEAGKEPNEGVKKIIDKIKTAMDDPSTGNVIKI